jgi:hypothetical protein
MLTVLRVLPFRQRLLRFLAAGTLSALGLLAGAVPSVGLDGVRFERAAYAQAVSDQEIQSYARSVLAIEPVRLAAYNKIKQMTGSNEVPVVACHRPSSLSSLPDTIRDVAVEYCNQAIAIVESNNLTITRFNQITVAHQSDSSLSDRIQQAINQIQAGN